MDAILGIEPTRVHQPTCHTVRAQIMPRVQSSVMTFVKYDDDGGELDITFTSGKTYRYLHVPLEIYDELLDAESKGEFFNENIKDSFVCSEVRSRRSR
jgi:hypothetical protein